MSIVVVVRITFAGRAAKELFEKKQFPNDQEVEGLPALTSIRDQFECYCKLQGGSFEIEEDDTTKYVLRVVGSDSMQKDALKDFRKWQMWYNRFWRRKGLKFLVTTR